MARIRTIKPDFWKDEKIMDCKPLERLLFIGLWNFADDYGRMAFAPRTIRADIFPEDGLSAADVEAMLMTLSSKGLIMIYTNGDKTYLAVTNWEKHQRIDNKAKPKIPGPFDSSSEEKQILASPSEDLAGLAEQSEKIGLEKEKEEEKEEEKETDSSTVAKANRRDEQFARFWKAYPERKGANPKKPARDVFLAKLKTGIDAEAIIAGAIACSVKDRDKIGTPYIPQAVKWLRDERWVDYQAQAPPQKDWRTLLRLYTSDTPGRRGNWMWGKGEPGRPGCEVPPDIQREFGFEPFNGASP